MARKYSSCVLLAVGVSVFSVAGVAVALVVARGVVAGLFFALIISKSSSGSRGMFNNLSQDPFVKMYLRSLSILVGAQVQREF